MKKFYPPLIWAVIVGILSLYPGSEQERESLFGIENLDKIGHMAFYALLVWLILQALKPIDFKKMIMAFVVAAVYGIFLEILQEAMNMMRAFETSDIIANIGGAILGIIFYKLMSKS